MKKVLLTFLAAGFCSAVNAATTSSTLSLNGSLASSCTSGFSTGTLSFIFVPGTQASAQNTIYTLTCTAGSVISAFTATSANGWNFKGSSSNDLIHYSITSVTASPYAAGVANVWSGLNTTPIDLLVSGAITIDGTAAPIQSNNNVYLCDIRSSDGALINCASTGSLFFAPRGIIISNSYAYIANSTGSTVTKCTIDGSGGLTACVNSNASQLNDPQDFTISGSSLLIANNGDRNIVKCIISPTSSIFPALVIMFLGVH